MSDDKLFQYLVSRVQTRETSTHAVASIASSTSLVLFGLFFSFTLPMPDKDIMKWIGIVSPIIGFAYFEITFATQQSWDYNKITKIIKKDYPEYQQDEINKIIFGEKDNFAIPKMMLWRILLILPFIGWMSIGREPFEVMLIIIYTGLSIYFLILRVQLKKQKERTKNNPSK